MAFMIHHEALGNAASSRTRALVILIRTGDVQFAGNRRLKIYGRLGCSSGKKMRPVNRVFFKSEEDAREFGFRPCAHCMRASYKAWKNAQPSPRVYGRF